jgi:N-acetylmuramoyl-L-alanine amidase
VRGTLPPAHATHLEAQPGFALTATGRSVLDANAKAAVRVNMPSISLNSGQLEVASVDHAASRARLMLEVAGKVVIDPGHGGTGNLPGSSSNNATSTSGVLEKTMTLRRLQRPGFRARAVAKSHGADVLVSIHYNGSNDTGVRGTVTFVRADTNGNVNRAEDLALAQRVQTAVSGAIPGGRDRGVADDTQTAVGSLAVLSDTTFGNTAALHPIRACLLEVEFITNPAVDVQLNTGAGAAALRQSIADALAGAIVSDLLNQP